MLSISPHVAKLFHVSQICTGPPRQAPNEYGSYTPAPLSAGAVPPGGGGGGGGVPPVVASARSNSTTFALLLVALMMVNTTVWSASASVGEVHRRPLVDVPAA